MPNIYMTCPDNNSPTGGIKKLYDQVDILNKNGLSAYIVHEKQGFKCTWFPNDTKIVYYPVQLKLDDYLVFPEIYGMNIVNTLPKVKKIIFNQNCYYTFLRNYSIDNREVVTPYTHPDIAGVIVVSEDSKNYLEYTFPGLKVYRTHISLDYKKFSYQESKKKQICFMPRKNIDEVIQVINILKIRGKLKEYDIIPIVDITEEQVAEVLKESEIFLSFGYPEGFSLPPFEAMACGCTVIGYHGMGGREFLNSEYSFPIDNGDIINFVKTVENVAQLWKSQPELLNEKRQKAYKFISQNYTKEREESDIINIWMEIFKQENKMISVG